jgi:uncharacterized membrane protein
MTEAIFEFLASIGFKHPLHPGLTHIPMGMVMGAVTFRIVALIPKFRNLARTGYHCIILGILGLFPTAFTGYLDWQHRYDGAWDEPLIIVKMVLAVLMLVLLSVIAIKDDPDQPKLDKNTLLYLVAVLIAVGLGFSGGELLYG